MPKTTMDLSTASKDELVTFLDSFDVIFSDCDGVLWHVDAPMDNTIETLNKLQSLKKKVFFVTNNTASGTKNICDKLRRNGFEATEDQVITLSKVIIWYLKKINFQGQAYTIGSNTFRNDLLDAGIELLDENIPKVYPNDVLATVNELSDRKSVKAVIADFNANCNWAHLNLAIACLRRADVLYITGAIDKWVFLKNGTTILGPGPLIDIITENSGRKPITVGKPSEILRNYIFEFCDITKPQRCLFIGDSINQDMKFATMCDFQKLFVSSGVDSFADSQNLIQELPEYYIPNLANLLSILNNLN
ncbi:PREDICTED: 4-nitrophenylphosphatase-like [Polistes canadensis]|uniref:4-nitrophenylphosphatase-like n=1 Tax=Polistes canadensis TaxID=91411 RepID=UPI0007190554|nr:PREDICTED: 4-nitrophenylphosphatase-like [Polistes canadensis]